MAAPTPTAASSRQTPSSGADTRPAKAPWKDRGKPHGDGKTEARAPHERGKPKSSWSKAGAFKTEGQGRYEGAARTDTGKGHAGKGYVRKWDNDKRSAGKGVPAQNATPGAKTDATRHGGGRGGAGGSGAAKPQAPQGVRNPSKYAHKKKNRPASSATG